MMTTAHHPNPDSQPDFYESVPFKRLMAWVVDIIVTGILAAIVSVPFVLFGIFLIFPFLFLPVIWMCTGFIYRWATISSGSATWGMRLMSIELRDHGGDHLDGMSAFLHTAGTYLCFTISPLQIVSMACMALTDRGQGLPDMVLNTVMLNRGE